MPITIRSTRGIAACRAGARYRGFAAFDQMPASINGYSFAALPVTTRAVGWSHRYLG
jgi:hypothetical protein